jgi:hypothetical protein
MRKYSDYQDDKSRELLTDNELLQIKWTQFKIIVPTQEDKDELIEAFEFIHDSDIDKEFVVINQLSGLYLEEVSDNIIVNSDSFKLLNTD